MKQLLSSISWREVALFFVLALFAGGCVGVAYYSGFSEGYQQTRTIIVSGVSNPGEQLADFTPFWNVWNAIQSRYVDGDASKQYETLLYGAISGLVDSLGDPHTIFFPPSDAEQFNADIRGEFEGIGAEIGLDENEQLVIIAPLQGTPASTAGLLAGDAIIAIDGESTAGISVDDAVKKIRGDRGSVVVLTIYRDEWNETNDLAITRGVIEIPTIEVERIVTDGGDDIVYARLYNFYEKAPALFYREVLSPLQTQPDGIVLDLRNNPGGYLEAAVHIAGWFVDEGDPVVTEEFQNSELNKTFSSQGPGVLGDVPTIVLINKGSASASEILAGALSEHNGTLLLGEQSFGKGTVQELMELEDGSLLKITVAHWVTPQGTLIDKNGITPDIEVIDDPNTEEDEVLERAYRELDRIITTK